MSDGDFLALLRRELAQLPGYIRHGTFQAVCRRAAEAGDRAFGAAAAADNRDRLLAAVWAAAQELEKVAHELAEGDGDAAASYRSDGRQVASTGPS